MIEFCRRIWINRHYSHFLQSDLGVSIAPWKLRPRRWRGVSCWRSRRADCNRRTAIPAKHKQKENRYTSRCRLLSFSINRTVRWEFSLSNFSSPRRMPALNGVSNSWGMTFIKNDATPLTEKLCPPTLSSRLQDRSHELTFNSSSR